MTATLLSRVAQGFLFSPWGGGAACYVFPCYKPTAVMIRRGLAANLRMYLPAGLENAFQLLVQLAEGQLLVWNVNGT